MKYNKEKHLKLLKSWQQSKNSKISDQFIPDENFFELEGYLAMMICHLHWESRNHYFELIENLLYGPIDFLELKKKHEDINHAGEKLASQLILLEPNKKCEGFDDLIDELVSLFDRYCPDSDIRESYEFNEEKLRQLIQKIFKEMKDNYL